MKPYISIPALIIWTDGDREGENIGFEIISVCRAIKANIQVHRAKFSEITPNAIRRACNNLVPPNAVIYVPKEFREGPILTTHVRI